MWTYRISCSELATLHQTVKGGFEDHVLRWDFFLLHSLCWQLLEELSNKHAQVKKKKKKLMPFLMSASLLRIRVTAASLETNLYVWLLRGSRWDLGVVVWLWGLHWETHHRSSDGGWWSVVIRELCTQKVSTWLLSKAQGQRLNLIHLIPFNLFSSAAKSEM